MISALQVTPLSKLAFLPPAPFEAGIHGPGAEGATLSYPPPSTLSGALAGIAYRKGLCTENEVVNAAENDFDDHRLCLQRLLGGDSIILRPGLLTNIINKDNYKYYVYIGASVFPSIHELIKALATTTSNAIREGKPMGQAISKTLNELLKNSTSVRARRESYTGIALERKFKRPLEKMIYTLERFEYRPASSILILTNSSNSSLKEIVKLGKHHGIASIHAERIDHNPLREAFRQLTSNSQAWALTLLTPALIGEGLGEPGTPITAGAKLARELAQRLLSGYHSVRNARAVFVPKPGRLWEQGLEIQYVGWSIPKRSPRRPYLRVPAGTVIILDNLLMEEAEMIAIQGVGEHSDLGWGTALLVPVHRL